jgi:DNA-binding transcriptional ArsR family regulator
MSPNPNIVSVASLIGESSRADMLLSLLGGKALPASELARAARVTPQTASSHLSKMVAAGLLSQESYGRHRYYRLANSDVAHALEALNAIAPPKPICSLRESDQSRALHFARTCYDHIAGEVGVAVTDKMLELCLLVDGTGRDFAITPEGATWFLDFGISLEDLQKSRRHLARRCLDWSERRHHMAGALGAAMTNRMFELRWLQRISGGRAVRVTDAGFKGLKDTLNLRLQGSS